MAFGDLVPSTGAGLLGSVWTAKQKQGDDYDRVRVVGSTIGVLGDGATRTAELVIAPADTFGTPVSADVEAFRNAYASEVDTSAVDDLDAQFAAVVRGAA